MSEKKGFTLVELLVVIAIIALLMAILMPALNRVKKQARSAACKVQLRQWSLMWKIYCDDNDDKFCSPLGDTGWQRGHWILPLREKWETKSDLLRCPSAVKPPLSSIIGSSKYGGTSTTYEMGGNDPRVKEQKCSYGFNCWLFNPNDDNRANGHIQDRPIEWNWKTPTVQGAGEIPVFADSMWRGGGQVSGDTAENAPGIGIERSNPPAYDGEWSGAKAEMKHFCIDRHNGRINMLFLDWHVREVGLKELWTLKWHREYNTAGPWTKAGGIQPRDWPEWMRDFKDY